MGLIILNYNLRGVLQFMQEKIITDITNYIFVADNPQKSDVILLPGGSFPEQAEYAAKLFNDGFANKCLPSGGVSVKATKFNGVKSKQDIYNKDYKTDCEFLSDVLIKNGVPKNAIFAEYKSGHTRDNAFMSRIVADENGLEIKKAIIVCKSFHARRCLMLYQMAFPKAEIIVCPFNAYNINRENWHTFEYGIDRVLGELARCGNQFVGDIKEYLL